MNHLVEAKDKSPFQVVPGCCNGKKTDGTGLCRARAGHGTQHPGEGYCKFHGGASPNHMIAVYKRRAREAVATFGLPREVDPHTALLEEVYRSAGHVAWLGTRIAELGEDDLVWGSTKEVAEEGFAGASVKRTEAAAVNVWLRLYKEERAHLVSVCKTAIDCGIAERQVKLAEGQGQMLADVIERVFAELGVDVTATAVRETVRRHLSLVSEEGRRLP